MKEAPFRSPTDETNGGDGVGRPARLGGGADRLPRTVLCPQLLPYLAAPPCGVGGRYRSSHGSDTCRNQKKPIDDGHCAETLAMSVPSACKPTLARPGGRIAMALRYKRTSTHRLEVGRSCAES